MNAQVLTPPASLPPLRLLRRETVAALASLATIGALVYLQHAGRMPSPHREEPPQLMVQLAPVPEPLPTPVATPQPAQPTKPEPTPVKTAPTPAAKPTVSKRADAPATASPAADGSAKTASPDNRAATPTQATPAPVKPAAPQANPHADRQFEARVRALLEARKSYPTGRQAAIEKPAGTVHACVELARDGSVRNVSLEEGGGSPLLDQAARRLMQGLDYPAFPDGAYGGAAQHVFCTRLKYEPPGS